MLLMAILVVLVVIGSAAAYAADRRRVELVRRDELVERMQHGEWAQVLLQEREPFAARARRAQLVMMRHEHDQAAAERRRDELSRHAWHGENWSLGFVVVSCLATALWAVLFTVQRATDINVLIALDYPSPRVSGTVIALAFATIGVIASGLLGMHSLLPPWLRSPSRGGRITAAVMLAVISIVVMVYAQRIAASTPIDRFGPGATQPGQTPAEQRSATALGRTLTMAVPPLETAFSAAPVITAELAVVGFFALASNRAERRKLAAQRAIQAARQDFAGYAVALIAESGVPMGVIRPVLAHLGDLGVEPHLHDGDDPQRTPAMRSSA